MWTSGFIDQGELGDAGTALLHDSYQPFVWGTCSPVSHFTTWLVTVLSLKKQAPKIKSSSEIVQKREHLKMIPNILWYIRAKYIPEMHLMSFVLAHLQPSKSMTLSRE